MNARHARHVLPVKELQRTLTSGLEPVEARKFSCSLFPMSMVAELIESSSAFVVPLIPWVIHRDPIWTIAQVACMKLTLLTQGQKFHAGNFHVWFETKSFMHEAYTYDAKSKKIMHETFNVDSKSTVPCMKLPLLPWSQKCHAWHSNGWPEFKSLMLEAFAFDSSQRFHAWNFHRWLEVNIFTHETYASDLKSRFQCLQLLRLILSVSLCGGVRATAMRGAGTDLRFHYQRNCKPWVWTRNVDKHCRNLGLTSVSL